jgi:hypothetical protein
MAKPSCNVVVFRKVKSAAIFLLSGGFLMIEPFLQTNNPLCIKCNAGMRFSCKEAESSGFVHDVFECPKCRSTQSYITPEQLTLLGWEGELPEIEGLGQTRDRKQTGR